MSKATQERQLAKARIFGKTITVERDAVENHEIIRTAIPFEMKALDDKERTIEFIGSTATPDSYGDSVVQAGVDLSRFIKNPVIPWGHMYKDPPVAQAVEVGLKGGNLTFVGKFASIEELCSDLNHPSDYALFADSIYRAYKFGYLRAFSIGFIPTKYSGNWEDGYVFEEWELLEVSCVTVPANPDALALAFGDGTLTDRDRKYMLSQAKKLEQALTVNDKEKQNKAMSEEQFAELKTYIDEKFAGVDAKIADLVAAKNVEESEEDETAKPAEKSDGGAGDAADEADVEEVRSLVQQGLRDALGIIN